MRTPRTSPEWAHRPAVARLGITKPGLLAPFAENNRWKAYGDQIKPFNFLQSVMVQAYGYPTGVDEQRFHLVAPFTNDATRWIRMRWLDRYTGKRYSVTTRQPTGAAVSTVVAVKSYADVIEQYGFHPETKSAGRDGEACGRDTVGLLQRRVVYACEIVLIGKEANALDEVESGVVSDWSEVRNLYHNPTDKRWRSAMRILGAVPLALVANKTGLSTSAISRIRRNRQKPQPSTQLALLRAAAAVAQNANAEQLPANDSVRRPPMSRRCSNCGATDLSRNARYCSSRCRLRAFRSKRQARS
jgi:hypothetical protein